MIINGHQYHKRERVDTMYPLMEVYNTTYEVVLLKVLNINLIKPLGLLCRK